MTQIPNIKDTIKYIQDNNKAMEAIVKGAASTMISISEETEGVNLRKATKSMRHIASGMISYMGIVTNIIEELSRPYDNSKDLMQLLGYTESDKDGKKLVKPQYKTIEALQQISTVMKEVVSFMFEISKQDLGFKSQKNIRRNIKMLRSTMIDLTKFIISEFSTIMTKNNAYEIIELMMGAPGTVVKELQEIDDSTKTNPEKDNEKLRKRLEKKETEIQRGKKFGLLEVITSSLNIISQLNSIQFAGPLEFRKKLFILRKQLTLVFKSLSQMWVEISKDKSVFSFISFMNKDDNNLFDAIMNTGMVLDIVIKHGKIKNLFSIQIAIWAYSLFSEALTRLANMITDDSGAFAKLSDKALTKRIEAVKKNVTIISDIFKIIALMGLIAIPMLTLGLLIFPALWLMEGIIKVMVNVLNRIDSVDADKKLKELNSLIIGIIKIQAWLILMALAAAPAIIAMIIDIIFLGILKLFIYSLDLVLNIISKVININTYTSFIELSSFLLIIILIAATMIILGELSKTAVVYIWDTMIFLGKLLLFIIALGVLGAVISFLSPVIGISIIGLLLIAAMVGILAIVIISLAKIQELSANLSIETLNESIRLIPDVIKTISQIGMMGILSGISAVFMMGNVVLIRRFVRIVRLLNKINNFNVDGKKINQIVTDIKTILTSIQTELGSINFSLKFKWALKRSKKIINFVLRIARNLEIISNINTNYSKIDKNVSNVFKIIDDIETKIETWSVSENTSNLFKFKSKKRELNRSNKILNKIRNITETISEIQNIKFDESTIISHIEKIFSVVDMIDTIIEQKIGLKDSEKNDIVLSNQQKRELRRSLKRDNKLKNLEVKNIDKVTSILVNVGDMVSVINDLMKFNIKKDDVSIKITNLFECIDIIDGKIRAIYDGKKYEKNKYFESLVSDIKSINDIILMTSNLSDKNIENNGKVIDNYTKFIEKINTIKVENLEKTAKMIKQMARFSESINGNFDSLAESLNEKLMPVLEELKEIMSSVPDKLDNGFANTSRSIISTSQTPVSQSTMSQQVQMENPNISKEDLDRIVKTRLSEQTKMQSNSITSKIDELMDLLSTGKIRVETV